MATPKKETVKIKASTTTKTTTTTAKATTAKATAAKPRARKSPVITADAPRVLTHEQIAQRAHELYVLSGLQDGREMDFWLEAERQLNETVLA